MKELQIPAADYESRFHKIRQFLREENLGALFVYSPPMEHKWGQTGHVSYLSGWANHDRIVDSVVVVPAEGSPALLFAGLPYMRDQVIEVSSIQDVRMVRAVDPNAVAVSAGEDRPRTFALEADLILRENGLEGKEIGVVGVENMSVPFYESLMSYVPGKFKVARDIVAELRTVKSAAEIVLMRHAAHLSDLGFETMLKVASPGMRGIEIVAEMERVIRREGADHAKYWMASGPPPDWAGVRLDVKPHLRILQEGDLMASCSYVCFRGYWCHGHRTGTLRKPCPDLTETCKIAREAQDAGLAKMSPGIPVGHVGRAVRQKAAEHGWAIMGGRFGHGIGLDYAERPSITEEESMVLQPGVTTVLHSMFALPGSGAFFVPLGDVCCVTENGPEFLMAFPRTPFVAGQ